MVSAKKVVSVSITMENVQESSALILYTYLVGRDFLKNLSIYIFFDLVLT